MLNDRSLMQRRNATKEEKSMTPWLERYSTQVISWGRNLRKCPYSHFSLIWKPISYNISRRSSMTRKEINTIF